MPNTPWSTATARRSRAQTVLVAAQMALSVLLLIGAGLFVRSLWRVTTQDLGIHPERVLAAQVDFIGSGRSRTQIASFYERALERIRVVPGVEGATMAVSTPFLGALGDRVHLEGAVEWIGGADATVRSNIVADDFFATTGTAMVQGRDAIGADRAGTPTVVVNETLARLGWQGRSPVGDCVYLESMPRGCAVVIGVARDAHAMSVLHEDASPWVYRVLARGDSTGAFLRAVLVRASPRAVGLDAAIRRAMAELEPGLPYVDIRHLADEVETEVRPWRVGAAVFTALGTIAVMLAALGIYAAMGCSVALRTREIGVRMATGATEADVFRLVIGDGLRTAGVGVATGVAAALLASRWLDPLLFDTSSTDAGVFGGVVALVLALALVAIVIPARRAARVSPLAALQSDG